MKNLGDLFCSKARVEVLRTLCFLKQPVGLRKLSRISELHPRSTELALKSLMTEMLVVMQSSQGRPVYGLNQEHPETMRLQILFLEDMKQGLKTRTGEWETKAKEICGFLDDGFALLATGKESLREA